MLLILDSTVLLAILDADRASHAAARALMERSDRLALTTQSFREALAVATRPVAATGLGLAFPAAWTSLMALRIACGRVLFESEKWLKSHDELAARFRPTGRTVHDLGQVAFVHATANSALVSDDGGVSRRYGKAVKVLSVRQALSSVGR